MGLTQDEALEIVREGLQGVSYLRRDVTDPYTLVVEHEVEGEWFSFTITVGEPELEGSPQQP